MENQFALASLFFQENEERIYGPITRFQAREMSVRLQNRPRDASLLCPDRRVELTTLGKGRLGKGMAQIREERDGVVALFVEEGFYEVRRRQEQRQNYALPVAFRPLTRGVPAEIWHRAETLDISNSGLCLRKGRKIVVEKGTEAQLVLGTIPKDPRVEALLNGDYALSEATQGESTPLIRMTTVVRHTATRNDGVTTLGMQFLAMEPADRKRLSDLLSRAHD